mgnify:CR=1 FL=1
MCSSAWLGLEEVVACRDPGRWGFGEVELGAGVVSSVRIFGPNNGRWSSRGPKRAPGGRGVRDTYG